MWIKGVQRVKDPINPPESDRPEAQRVDPKSIAGRIRFWLLQNPNNRFGWRVTELKTRSTRPARRFSKTHKIFDLFLNLLDSGLEWPFWTAGHVLGLKREAHLLDKRLIVHWLKLHATCLDGTKAFPFHNFQTLFTQAHSFQPSSVNVNHYSTASNLLPVHTKNKIKSVNVNHYSTEPHSSTVHTTPSLLFRSNHSLFLSLYPLALATTTATPSKVQIKPRVWLSHL